MAAPHDTMVPNPTKPTRAMAKPSSMPVKKSRISAAEADEPDRDLTHSRPCSTFTMSATITTH